MGFSYSRSAELYNQLKETFPNEKDSRLENYVYWVSFCSIGRDKRLERVGRVLEEYKPLSLMDLKQRVWANKARL